LQGWSSLWDREKEEEKAALLTDVPLQCHIDGISPPTNALEAEERRCCQELAFCVVLRTWKRAPGRVSSNLS